MPHPLDESARRRMAIWSAVLCAIPLCLAPLAGRSAFESAGERAALDSRFARLSLGPPAHEQTVRVDRDPFIETSARNPVPPVRGKAPANATVTAVVTGASPRALIEDGATVRVVGIGDAVAGSRVDAISPAGVRLRSGALLPFAQERP